MITREQRIALAVGGVTTLATGAVYHFATTGGLVADFNDHVEFTAVGIRTHSWPGNVLLYWLDALLAGFSTQTAVLLGALVVILAVATGAKVLLSLLFVNSESLTERNEPAPWWALAWAAACGLAFSLPVETGKAYIGQIPPNVWHNSTTILLMPFAVGLFWASLSYLRTGRTRLLWVLTLLAALNVVAKPSFVLCLIVVFPLAALVRFGWSRRTLWAWAATAGAAVFVGLSTVYIYVSGAGDPAAQAGRGDSSLRIQPFHVWDNYSDTIVASFLASYLFPIVALAVGGATLWRSLAVRYALALAVTGLVWFVLVTETGPREYHGNFLWQAVVTNYLLFLAIVSAAGPWLRTAWGRPGPRLRAAVMVVAFGLHFVAGVYYLHFWFRTGSFY